MSLFRDCMSLLSDSMIAMVLVEHSSGFTMGGSPRKMRMMRSTPESKKKSESTVETRKHNVRNILIALEYLLSLL